MHERRRSWWGWGWEDEALDLAQTRKLGEALARRFGVAGLEAAAPVALDALRLRPPRIAPPATLVRLCSSSTYDRASHAYGKSYRDVVRGFRGEYPHPPDVVAFPTSEAEVVDVLDWAAGAGAAVVPYGGGSSVVGGVECDPGDGYAGVVTIDLHGLDRLVEVDRLSRAARIQAGALGPVVEDQLRHHGYTLRHFPQSFEFSTLGGWLATRSGGHFATLYTHIDDFVESLRVVTPAGTVETRRLPGSGAGPSPDRLFLGSEGTLGLITEAWMRVQERPRHRASAVVHFPSFEQGAIGARTVAQAHLYPANCRLLDPEEAAMAAGVSDGSAVLLLGFESADRPVEPYAQRALELCEDHGGTCPLGIRVSTSAEKGEREGVAGAWRDAFLRAPYGRDAMVALGVISETFETACTWDRLPDLHHDVMRAATRAVREVCGDGFVTCRFTHVYPDGPAPYFTVLAPARRGSELAQWGEIKAAASEALLAAGGTITHHHAVGRDHRPWYDRQRPDPFAAALRAAKAAVDPDAVLNPGVLVDPLRA